jgi:single-strand DNA-binding protein
MLRKYLEVFVSKDLNEVTVIGNLTRDPELKYTTGNKAVCKISIANNQDFGDKKYVNYFDCTCWEKLGEVAAQYLKKGSKVAIHGVLRQERWTHEEKTMSKIGILANEIQFLSQREKPDSNNDTGDNSNKNDFSGNPYKNENTQPEESFLIDGNLKDDDIPF